MFRDGLLAAMAAAATVLAASALPASAGQAGNRTAVFRQAAALRAADTGNNGNDDADRQARRATILPLVQIDEELQDYLDQAARHIASRQFDEAIEILQALITTGQHVFCPAEPGSRRFVPVRSAAAALLARLPPEGQDLYRRLNEPTAERLWHEAQQTGESSLLRRIIDEYPLTRPAVQATDRLAAAAFDEGRFVSAARLWEDAADSAVADPADCPMRLAKAALAWHLAGQPQHASRLARRLRRDYPAAEGPVAGRTENLAAMVEKALLVPPPPPAPATDGWTSLTKPTGDLAAASPWHQTMLPLWSQPEEADRRESLVRGVLGLPPAAADDRQESPRRSTFRMELRDGHVRVSSLWPAQNRVMLSVAAAVHPVVVGQEVIVREHDEVVAYDLATGRRKWQTSGLPMWRSTGRPLPFGYPFHQFAPLVGDAGRFALTAAGDKVFTVCGYLPSAAPALRQPRAGEQTPTDGSILVAVSISGQGKVLWQVGDGQGDTELVRQGKFLTVPTFAAGRLYALILHLHAYHVACLDAETGASIWSSVLGQEPSLSPDTGPWHSPMYTYLVTERGSPPAVADGCVYATTNAGLVGALDAETGRPIWIYQYPSTLTESADPEATRRIATAFGGDPGAAGPLHPAGPVIAAGGLVTCLPSDSPTVLALDARTGEPVWQADRQGQHDLTVAGPERLVLSGNGAIVLDARTGRTLLDARDVGPIVGRPAVAGQMLLASGQGEFVRLDLTTGQILRQPLPPGDAHLGRLVAAGGRLVAANAAGISVYFAYDDAWDHLGRTLAETRTPAERLPIHLRRGQFALLAGRLDEAEGELRAAADLASTLAELQSQAAVRPWLYRLALARAAASDDDTTIGRHLAEAEKHAPGQTEQAEMLLRRMQWNERFGRPAAAADCAQELSERYPAVRLRDVTLEPLADLAARRDNHPPHLGYILGQRHVRRLIDKHGRAAYARAEQAAAEALRQSGPAGDVDALLAAQRRFPHSAAAPELLLAAAELLYQRASVEPAQAYDLIARADRVLGELTDYSRWPGASRGRAAAVIVAHRLYADAAGVICDAAAGQGDDAVVQFGDFRGTLKDLSARLSAAPATPHPTQPPIYFAPPAQEVYRFRDDRLVLLRGLDRKPLRAGPLVFLHGEGRLACIDTRRSDAASAVLWTAEAGQDVARRVGCLINGGRRLVTLDGEQLALFEAATGAIVYQKDLGDLGTDNWADAQVCGDYLVLAQYQGRARCISLSSGEVVWQTPQPKTPNPPILDARADVVVVQNQAMREVRVVDLLTGKTLMEVSSERQRVEAVPTDDGLVAVVQEGAVSLLDPRRVSRGPLWQVAVADRQLVVLGACGRHAAIWGGATRTIYLIDLASGGPRVAQIPLALPGAVQATPSHAVFDDHRMYLVAGMGGGPAGRGTARRFANHLNPVIQAFDLRDARPLWMTALPVQPRVFSNIEQPVMLGAYLAVLVRPNDHREAVSWLVLAKETGEPVASGGMTADELAEAATAYSSVRRGIIGPPLVTNGRLLAEDETGMVMLRCPL